jgi:membrane fusion protein, multidrug efflux system
VRQRDERASTSGTKHSAAGFGFSGAIAAVTEFVLSPDQRSAARRKWIAIAVLPIIGFVAYLSWDYFHASAGATVANASATSGASQAAIPVTAALARQSDFPVYLSGLGTVEPYDTVMVRSRVDGQIMKIGFKQGQMVAEGDVLAQIDPRPYQAALDQALAKKAQDAANLKDARLDLQRFDLLAKQNFGSRQQADTQQAKVDQLTAQIAADQAVIDNARTQVDYTTIRSPLSGKTGFRLVDPGNIVHAADTTGIVTVVKLQPISVVFTAPEEDVPQINRALAAGEVPVAALSSDAAQILSQGRLALVNNAVDQASGTISMKATFANKDNVLWPGLSVSTRLLVDTLKQVVVVPEDAVQHGPAGLYAFVIGQDNKAAMRQIEVGAEGNGESVVLKGLSAGENVVVSGQYRLQQGSLVKVTEVKATGATAAGGPGQIAENRVMTPP